MKKLVLSLFALVLMAGPALANDAPHGKPHGKPMHHRPCHAKPCDPEHCDRMHKGMPGQDFFRRFDLNHDGRITKAEFDKASDRFFARLDANHDGVVTKAEARQDWEKHMEKMRGMREGMHDGPGPRHGWAPRGGHGRHAIERLDYSHANDDDGR